MANPLILAGSLLSGSTTEDCTADANGFIQRPVPQTSAASADAPETRLYTYLPTYAIPSMTRLPTGVLEVGLGPWQEVYVLQLPPVDYRGPPQARSQGFHPMPWDILMGDNRGRDPFCSQTLSKTATLQKKGPSSRSSSLTNTPPNPTQPNPALKGNMLECVGIGYIPSPTSRFVA